MPTIDQLLYRPIKSGSQYNALIPTYNKTEYSFDPNAKSINTYDTLKYMSDWANKYAYQMQKIAPTLLGRTIPETVNNIYQFLYWHFQYKLDGQTQNLYAPSAAWYFRNIGFDCKTYSLLASTILLNLKIPHAFRMVQQKGIMPGEWSHVYVVVKANNTEYVIDATKTPNKEVSYTKKYDLDMHKGLAVPYTGTSNGLGCSCNGKLAGAPINFGNIFGGTSQFTQGMPQVQNQQNVGFWGTVSNLSGGNIGGVNVSQIQGYANGSTPISGLANNMSIQGVQGSTIMGALQGNQGAINSAAGTITKDWTAVGVPVTTIGRAVAGDPVAMAQVGVAVGGKLSGKLSIAGFPMKDLFSSPTEFKPMKYLTSMLKNVAKIKCIGGSAFGGGQAQEVVANIDDFITNQIIAINVMAKEGALDALSQKVAEFGAVLDMAKTVLQKRQNEGFNVCSRENFQSVSDYAKKANEVIGRALIAWVNKYYPVETVQGGGLYDTIPLTPIVYTTVGNQFFDKYKIKDTFSSQKIEMTMPVYKRKISPTETTLLAFEPTAYLAAMANDLANFKDNDFFSSLKTILAQKPAQAPAPTPAPAPAPTPAPNANTPNGSTPNAGNGTNNDPKDGSNVLLIAAAGIAAKLLLFS